MSNEMPLLRLEGVGKEFDGNRVLSDINFSLEKGKILGLIGENGAGKSTLMKILFGMPVIADTGGYEGKIYLNGKEVRFTSPVDALKAGIGMVHQEFSLIPGFTVAENISLNMEKTKSSIISKILGKRLETLDMPFIRKKAERSMDTLGIQLGVDTLVSETPVGYKQFIEIAREIDRDQINLLVLDEPTAVLTETEAELLLKAMKRLADLGVSIVFISHRLQEIIDVCDTLVVLRDGNVVVERPCEGATLIQIAEWMVGRDVEGESVKKHKTIDASEENRDNILEVKHLWVDMPGELVRDVSFTVKRGEIFGIGGLAGQGKLGIPNGIMSLMPSGGEVLFNGSNLKLTSTYDALKNGLALVSEDRKGVGLLLDEPIYWNIAFNAMQIQDKFLIKVLGGLFMMRDENAMKNCAKDYINALEIRCTNEKQKVRQLSGGNQQKVCLAKAFAMEPVLLFVSEPTRGIDIGAKRLVLNSLRRYNEENNTTIVIVSSELEELRSICQRIAIICEGRVGGILPSDAKAVDFGLLMSGVKTLSEGSDQQ